METTLERRTMAKVAWRLLPLIIVIYFVAYIDRTNVGFAAISMNQDLGFTPYLYGWGAGIFFIGYALFEVPSNVILHRVGARIWIARIMLTWGLVSGCMALVSGPASFLTLRFLLGVAEAGFFPGVLLYFTYWFPKAYRARVISALFLAVPGSNAARRGDLRAAAADGRRVGVDGMAVDVPPRIGAGGAARAGRSRDADRSSRGGHLAAAGRAAVARRAHGGRRSGVAG